MKGRRRRIRGSRVVRGLLLASSLGALPVFAVDAAAQGTPGELRARENVALREAQSLETAGDLAGAERVLRALLAEQPGSTGGLFGLERLLRVGGRLGEILPLVDAGIASGENAAAVRFLKLRILVELDELDVVVDEVERWVRESPGSADPYREGARALERAQGPAAALALLERGEAALGPTPALSLDAGDVLIRAGDPEGAGLRWAAALEEGEAHLASVARRIQGVGSDRPRVLEAVLGRLGRDGAPPSALRNAAILSLQTEEATALALAERAVARRSGPEWTRFLERLATDAVAAERPRVALLALEALRREAGGAEARAMDARIASTALSAGDTARALEARNREAESLPRGSGERRKALAEAIRLEAQQGGTSRLRERLEAFRLEFPGAGELDDIAGNLAQELLESGDSLGARSVLRGLEGGGAARERALLALAGPDPRSAREDLLEASGTAPASQATELLQLAGLMDALGDEGVRLAAEATLRSLRGEAAAGADLVEEGFVRTRAADHPPLLALAARLSAQAGDVERAARLYEVVVTRHPDASEAAEATLALARWKARSPGGLPAAVALLEDFIVRQPSSPAAPEARRELTRLRAGGGNP